VVFWWSGATGGPRIISHWDIGTNQRSFYVTVNSTEFMVYLTDTGIDDDHDKVFRSIVDYTDGVSRMFGFTFNGNETNANEANRMLRLFLNGSRIAEASLTMTSDDAFTTIANSTAQVLLGAGENNSVAVNFTEGTTEEVWLYERTLSNEEMSYLYYQTLRSWR